MDSRPAPWAGQRWANWIYVRSVRIWFSFCLGLGLHLEQLAQLEQTRNKCNLHETSRKLSSLNPYEHLHRILRICTVHTFRNIRSCPVSDSVRLLMRSLVCMVHSDWDGTIQAIKDHGGKAGLGEICKDRNSFRMWSLMISESIDWIKDKERTKFAFQGMCWEKSFIPEEVWRAGEANSNLIETVHRDVNREGVQCTLVGGLKKGQLFDKVKMTTLKVPNSLGCIPHHQLILSFSGFGGSGHMSYLQNRSSFRKCCQEFETEMCVSCLMFPKRTLNILQL